MLQQLFCSVSQTEHRIRAVHSELTATSTLDAADAERLKQELGTELQMLMGRMQEAAPELSRLDSDCGDALCTKEKQGFGQELQDLEKQVGEVSPKPRAALTAIAAAASMVLSRE